MDWKQFTQFIRLINYQRTTKLSQKWKDEFSRKLQDVRGLAHLGDADAQYCLSSYYTLLNDDENSLKWTLKASRGGNVWAKYNLARYYFEGKKGLAVDPDKGIAILNELLQTQKGKIAQVISSYISEHFNAQCAMDRLNLKKPAHPIHGRGGYQWLTNADNPKFRSNDQLNALKANLKKEVKNNKSSIALSLKNLSESEKSALIAALISGNKEVIVSIMGPLCKDQLGDLSSLGNICEHKRSADSIFSSDGYLNETVGLVIKQTLSSLTNEDKKRILQNAYQKIPDSLLSIKDKATISREIDPRVARSISDYAYNESLEPIKNQIFKGNVSLENLKILSKTKDIDISEAIILSYAYLKTRATSPEDLAMLDKIKNNYLFINYEQCKADLIELSSKLTEETANQCIGDLLSNAKEVVLEKNHSRRFFENRLSQLYLGNEFDLKGVSKISERILGKSVNSFEDAEHAILSIAETEDWKAGESSYELKSGSGAYQKKDRDLKPGFMAKEQEGNIEKSLRTPEVGSRNKGVLKSTSPNFYDEIAGETMVNRVVDVNTTYGNARGYSQINKRSAFASSLSGHTFYIVGVLEQYMQKNKADPNLNSDINNFLKAYVATYISRGYHSYLEVMHVLQEPNVQAVFKKHNVPLDLSISTNTMEKIFNDSAEYALMLGKKKAVHNELSNPSTDFKLASRAIRDSAKQEEEQEMQIKSPSNNVGLKPVK